jgi:hypothetical protein
MKTSLAVAALLLAAAAPAFAQRGPDDFLGRRVSWYPSIEAAVGGGGDVVSEAERRRMRFFGEQAADKKYFFVYVRPLNEEREPNEFLNNDVVQASRGAWCFVKMDFDKENRWLKAWGIPRAPALIGGDLHGNDFGKAASASIDNIRGLLKTVPDAVGRYEQKLKADWTRVNDLLKLDEEKAAKALVDFCALAKPGYKESAEAQAKLNEVSESALKRGELAESVSVEIGIAYYDDLAKTYAKTTPGLLAQIRAAFLEHERGHARKAIDALQKIQKLDRLSPHEMEEANRALLEISKRGEQKIDAALGLGDRGAAKEALRKLASEYAGTEAGRRALDVSR